MMCGSKSHTKKNTFCEPTLGLPPLTLKGVHPKTRHELLWEMKDEHEALLLHQLVFEKPDGKKLV